MKACQRETQKTQRFIPGMRTKTEYIKLYHTTRYRCSPLLCDLVIFRKDPKIAHSEQGSRDPNSLVFYTFAIGHFR